MRLVGLFALLVVVAVCVVYARDPSMVRSVVAPPANPMVPSTADRDRTIAVRNLAYRPYLNHADFHTHTPNFPAPAVQVGISTPSFANNIR